METGEETKQSRRVHSQQVDDTCCSSQLTLADESICREALTDTHRPTQDAQTQTRQKEHPKGQDGQTDVRHTDKREIHILETYRQKKMKRKTHDVLTDT